MSPKSRNDEKLELVQSPLDLLILQTLVWQPQHGYGIGQSIRRHSNEALDVETGSLYPALHRLERERWIQATWKTSRSGPPIRVYRITAAGKRQLEQRRSRWKQLMAAVAGVLQAAEERG